MSTATAGGVDARGYLTSWLGVVTDMTIKDVNAIPDDKWSESSGGCARAPKGLLADVVTNLIWTTETIQGTESSAYNNMEAMSGAFADKAHAVAEFKSATNGLIAAINAASDEKLNSTVMAPWQMPTPVFMLAHIAVSHIWYHDGQFNLVQCQLGDEKVHWME